MQDMGDIEPKEGVRQWNKNLKTYFHHIRLFDGVKETLEKLRDHSLTLGIITSKTREEFENDFLPFGVDDYFSTVVCAEDSKTHKPEPGPMLAYLEKSGATAERVLYVGDTLYDMRCAKGAGVDHALALWGAHNPEKIGATHRLEKPECVLDILL